MKVVAFKGGFKPDKVLKAAVGKLESVIVIGTTKEGEPYIASSMQNAETFLHLAKGQQQLLDVLSEKII